MAKSLKEREANYLEKIEALGLPTELIGEYVTGHTPTLHRCSEGHETLRTPSNVLTGHTCSKCSYASRKKRKHTKTHEDFIAEMAERQPDVQVIGHYEGSQQPIALRCTQGHNYEQTPSNALRGRECRVCTAERLIVEQTKTHEEYELEVALHLPGTEVLDSYVDYKTKLRHRCPQGHTHLRTPKSVLGSANCPQCKAVGFQMGKPAQVYIMQHDLGDAQIVNIGVTGNDMRRRYDHRTIDEEVTRRVVMPFKSGAFAFSVEQAAHQALIDHRSKRPLPTLRKDGTEELYTCSFDYALGILTRELINLQVERGDDTYF